MKAIVVQKNMMPCAILGLKPYCTEQIVGYARNADSAQELIDVVAKHLRCKYNMHFVDVSQENPVKLTTDEGCGTITIVTKDILMDSVELSNL